jgi:hypothetical protein
LKYKVTNFVVATGILFDERQEGMMCCLRGYSIPMPAVIDIALKRCRIKIGNRAGQERTLGSQCDTSYLLLATRYLLLCLGAIPIERQLSQMQALHQALSCRNIYRS